MLAERCGENEVGAPKRLRDIVGQPLSTLMTGSREVGISGIGGLFGVAKEQNGAWSTGCSIAARLISLDRGWKLNFAKL
jgi:hypothetical protein